MQTSHAWQSQVRFQDLSPALQHVFSLQLESERPAQASQVMQSWIHDHVELAILLNMDCKTQSMDSKQTQCEISTTWG